MAGRRGQGRELVGMEVEEKLPILEKIYKVCSYCGLVSLGERTNTAVLDNTRTVYREREPG